MAFSPLEILAFAANIKSGSTKAFITSCSLIIFHLKCNQWAIRSEREPAYIIYERILQAMLGAGDGRSSSHKYAKRAFDGSCKICKLNSIDLSEIENALKPENAVEHIISKFNEIGSYTNIDLDVWTEQVDLMPFDRALEKSNRRIAVLDKKIEQDESTLDDMYKQRIFIENKRLEHQLVVKQKDEEIASLKIIIRNMLHARLLT